MGSAGRSRTVCDPPRDRGDGIETGRTDPRAGWYDGEGTVLKTTLYQRRGDAFEPTGLTRGPWDERVQHGGPPSALLLSRLAAALAEDPGFAVVRLTTEFLRPVPLAPLRVEVEPSTGGRRVRRVRARLIAEATVMEATAVFVREDPDLDHTTLVRPGTADEPWPEPEGLAPFAFPFFSWEEAYHRAIDVRVVDAPWGTTPVRCWARPVVGLVDGEPPSPEEAVVLIADAESGMGPPLDPLAWSYVNPDLTVYFGRRPTAGWIGYAIRSRADGAGIGLAESELRDATGVFGQCAQSLVLARR